MEVDKVKKSEPLPRGGKPDATVQAAFADAQLVIILIEQGILSLTLKFLIFISAVLLVMLVFLY